MFGRHEIVKVIKRGDLDRLKKMLEEDQDLLEKTFKWKSYLAAGILHIAASNNQPEIVKFLITEKGMDIDKTYYNSTPLYYAAQEGASQAVKTLIDLGANPDVGYDPYKVCKDEATTQIFKAALQERRRQEEQLKSEAAQRETAAMIEGVWESDSPDKVTFEHDMSGHRFRLTEEFDFAAECWTQVTKDLRDGQISPTVEKSFNEVGNKKIDEARTQLEKIRGGIPAEVRKPELTRLKMAIRN